MSIFCDNDEIPMVKDDYDSFLHKTTVIYGSSGTGKSVIIKHILYLLKDIIPNVIVFAPTNELNHTYDNHVPPLCIHKDVDIELINSIYQRQVEAIDIFNLIHDQDKLYQLFLVCSSEEEQYIYNKIKKCTEAAIVQYDYSTVHISKKKADLTSIKKIQDNKIYEFIKHVIKKKFNNTIIDNNKNLSEEQKRIVRYIDFNPNIILIFDDCADNVKEWGTSKELLKLFFAGRHYHITTIIALQDEQMLTPKVRSNAFNSIFTQQRVATAYFGRNTNSFSKSERKLYEKYGEEIFHPNEITKSGEEIVNYKRLVYLRDDTYKIKYILANVYEEFIFGSEELWNLSNKCRNKDIKKSISKFSRLFA